MLLSNKLCSIIIIMMNFVPFLTFHHLPSTIYVHRHIHVRLISNIETGECQLKRMICSGEISSTIEISNPKPFIHTYPNRPHTRYTYTYTYNIHCHFTYTEYRIYIPNEKWNGKYFRTFGMEKEKKQDSLFKLTVWQCAHRRRWVMKSDTTKKEN